MTEQPIGFSDSFAASGMPDTTLNGAITDTALLLTVRDLPPGVPTNRQFSIKVDAEWMRVASIGGVGNKDWTIRADGRGFAGTAPMAHLDNAPVFTEILAEDLEQLRNELIAKATVAAKGDLLVATAAATVTRLPVEDGKYLKGDLSTPTGLAWDVVVGGGGGGGGGGGAAITGVRVTRVSGDVSLAGGATAIPFDAEAEDTDGFHDNATNPTRLTVPAGMAGVYVIFGGFYTDAGSDVTIRRNGTTEIAFGRTGPGASSLNAYIPATAFHLADGDYVELVCTPQGASRVVFDAGHASPHFGMYRVGGGGAPDYILIRDEKAQGTGGGTFTSGAWQTRVLNTEVSDTGNHASLASNQITLAAGTYECRIRCPAVRVQRHQARLYNITDAAVVLLGTSQYAGEPGNYESSDISVSEIIGRFTLASSKVLEVQHQCATTHATLGFGIDGNFSTEIFTVAEFHKVA